MNSDMLDEKMSLEEISYTSTAFQKWDELNLDILLKILKLFNTTELISGVSRVCRHWRQACRYPTLWKNVDFGFIQSSFIIIPRAPYIWVSDASTKYLMKHLKISLGLGGENMNCLIFHLDLYLNDAQLTYVAERSPHLKRLVLPSWNRLTKGILSRAVLGWPQLESLTMPSIPDPSFILDMISSNCPNFSQLKVMGAFNLHFASSVATCLPNLKVLSLRCSMIWKEAIHTILDSLQHLEELNISHCLFVEGSAARPVLTSEVDEAIVVKASRLRNFLTCADDHCVLCWRMKIDEGNLRWNKCEEGQWREDEVSVFAI